MINYINKELIIKEMKEKGISKEQMCKLCNISIEIFEDFLLGTMKIDYLFPYKIAKILDLETIEFIEKPDRGL